MLGQNFSIGLQENLRKATMPTLWLNPMGKKGYDPNRRGAVEPTLPSPDSNMESPSTCEKTLSPSPSSAATKIAYGFGTSTSMDQSPTVQGKAEDGASPARPGSIWQRLDFVTAVSDRPWHKTWIRCECWCGQHCFASELT
jgi:hypothetical protein